MDKEQFNKELDKAYKNPKKYFEIRKEKNPETGKKELVCNMEKLNDFFKSFSTHYLDADVAAFTDKFPEVQFKNLDDFDKFAIGRHNSKTQDIDLNLNLFLKLGFSRTVLSGYLTTLCHEHQHFKQNLYVELKNSGRLEEAKALEPLLASTSEHATSLTVEKIEQSVKQPVSRTSLIAHTMFMKETMPKDYNKLKSSNILSNIGTQIANRSPVEVAAYFNDAHEIDARDRSVDVFVQKMEEINEVNQNPTLDKYSKRIEKWLPKINRAMLKIQPQSVLDDYEALKQNISAEHLLKFAEKIDAYNQQQNIEPTTLNDKGSFSFDHEPTEIEVCRQSFVIVLKERLGSMNEQEANELIQKLKTSNSPYAKHIAEQIENEKSIEHVDPEQIKEERAEMEVSQPTLEESSSKESHQETPQKTETLDEKELLEQESQPQ